MIKPFYQDSQIIEYQGHTPDVLRELPAESVHMVVTSVPYWGLRDYGLEPQVWDELPQDVVKCEHEWGENQRPANYNYEDKIGAMGNLDKGHQKAVAKTSSHFCQKCNAWRGSLGLELTPELYIQHIVQVFQAVKRVLRKDGTCWLNIGDTYHGGGAGNYGSGLSVASNHGQHLTNVRNRIQLPGLKPKDLCMIPARVALALQADGWWLRSDIIWSKPNPMPESVTDRPTTAHEHVFLLAKSQKYFYDADAVREDSQASEESQKRAEYGRYYLDDGKAKRNFRTGKPDYLQKVGNDYGYCGQRNLRSVWTIATEPTPEAHFATFPSKLCEIAIKAGTSEKGCCPECGEPWVRVVEKTKSYESNAGKAATKSGSYDLSDSGSPRTDVDRPEHDIRFGPCIQSKTIGWKPSCECNRILIRPGGRPSAKAPYPSIPCTVLDPFSGSGKALIVAKKLGRKAIGIDLKLDYLKMPLKKLAQERLI